MNLSEPKVVPNGPCVPKTIIKVNEKPKSKLGLPIITIRGQINPSTKISKVTQKKVSCTSSNRPPRNYCGAPKVRLKTCTKGIKLRVYNGHWLHAVSETQKSRNDRDYKIEGRNNSHQLIITTIKDL